MRSLIVQEICSVTSSFEPERIGAGALTSVTSRTTRSRDPGALRTSLTGGSDIEVSRNSLNSPARDWQGVLPASILAVVLNLCAGREQAAPAHRNGAPARILFQARECGSQAAWLPFLMGGSPCAEGGPRPSDFLLVFTAC